MRVLSFSGSRADQGGIEATHQALIKKGIESTLFRYHIDTSLRLNGFDLVVVLGDRSEVLQFAVDFYLQKLPIAHLSGGDITEGSQDDSMRHAITKLSHLHFPTNEESAKRIIQMGEEPWRVHVVGYPGVDDLQVSEFPPAWLPDDGSGEFDFILVVWHPNTLASEDQAFEEAKVLTEALDNFNSHFVVVGPNLDIGNDLIRGYLKTWCNIDGNDYVDTLPRPEYLWLLKHTKCLVGNSSSGFYEAPSFGTPVVNIGDRQKGREYQPNIFPASLEVDDIAESIALALSLAPAGMPTGNFYATGNAADKIAEVIANIKDPKQLLLKKFHDIKQV